MANIIKQARLFQTYRKLFGWDDEASHYDVRLYMSSSFTPQSNENVVLFSEDGTCALRYSGGDSVVFISVQDETVTNFVMAKAATSHIFVEQNQLVMATLGKPEHPQGQWQRFLYLITNHVYNPDAMLTCHARSEETTNLSMLSFEAVRNGMLPNIYASTFQNWPGGDLHVEYKFLPSVLDGPVFRTLKK